MELRICEVDKGGGSGGDKGGRAKRRALFPAGRGLGVGRKESKSKKEKEYKKIQPTHRSRMALKAKMRAVTKQQH